MNDELVTMREAARRLGRSHQRLSQLAQRADFPERHRIGNAWAVAWPEVEAWFRERTLGTGGRPRKPRS
jgi:predicted DNA-binding transcriptional regulator AlpA